MRRFAAMVGALAFVAGGADAATVASGLQGKVVEFGGGACAEGTDCKAPLAGAVLAFSRSGATVRTRTHDDGSYRVRLAPGVYAVRVVGQGPRTRIQPSTTAVRRARFRVVEFVVTGTWIP
jgi:hypothetical protein